MLVSILNQGVSSTAAATASSAMVCVYQWGYVVVTRCLPQSYSHDDLVNPDQFVGCVVFLECNLCWVFTQTAFQLFLKDVCR